MGMHKGLGWLTVVLGMLNLLLGVMLLVAIAMTALPLAWPRSWRSFASLSLSVLRCSVVCRGVAALRLLAKGSHSAARSRSEVSCQFLILGVSLNPAPPKVGGVEPDPQAPSPIFAQE